MRFLKKLQVQIIFMVFGVFFGSITPALSCSTPVFRYALEMWGAYAYVVEVLHEGPLTAEQKETLEYLKKTSFEETPVNIKVVEKTNDFPSGINKEDLPMIRLSYPIEHEIHGLIWEGALTKENAKRIVDSPVRNQVLNNIQRGDAAVWLFLESGNAIKDDKQFNILKSELERLSNTLKLSETATDVAGNLLDIKVINTGVSFSLIRIKKGDPAEEVFANMLIGTEADLKIFKNAPLAFPVFGQGRALYALVGNGIKANNIETACSTIIGWCSCTIKDDNPGTDLLMRADWEEVIGDSSWIQPEQVPDITGLSGFVADISEVEEVHESKTITASAVDPKPVVETSIVEQPVEEKSEPVDVVEESPKETVIPTIATEPVLIGKVSDESSESSMNPLLRNSLLAFGLLLVVMVATSFVLKRKQE